MTKIKLTGRVSLNVLQTPEEIDKILYAMKTFPYIVLTEDDGEEIRCMKDKIIYYQ